MKTKSLSLHDCTNSLSSATFGLYGNKLAIDVYYGYDCYGILIDDLQLALLKEYLNALPIKTDTVAQ